MENRGEYVMFSKETCLLDTASEKLRKELEEELKLSSHNLQSHAWYHGRIPWEVSESLVLQDGDFLIRDSMTSLGDYVLTCRWNQKPLHFLISKVMLRSSDTYTRLQYVLEGEQFDSIPALVHFYVGGQTPLTQHSGAHVISPVNRTVPLCYLETIFGQTSQEKTPLHSPVHRKGSLVVTEALAFELITPQREAVKSFVGSLEQRVVVTSSPNPMNTLHRRRRSPSRNRKFVVVPSSPVMQRPNDKHPCTSPTKSPVIYLEPTNNSWSLSTESCQSTTVDPSDLQSNTGLYPHSLVHIESSISGQEDQTVPGFMDEDNEDYLMPLVIETASSFRPSLYQSLLLPAENKPLEAKVLKRAKEVLVDADTKTMAMHITKIDSMVARISDLSSENIKGMAVSSGMELLTLPHGHHLRQDLLERFYTMSIMLAMVLLGCTGSVDERGSLLHRMISLASELKTNLGNMFGFAAVMRVLELPQIVRLKDTWMSLRQKYTESAVLYEKTLRPSLKRMTDGKELCEPSETTVPHVLPLLLLLEKSAIILEGSESWESLDSGMDSVLCHLNSARIIARHGETYCSNAKAKLQGFHEQPDVLEVFLTEFQMRLLWGSRGAEASREERYEKFDKVLTALSNRLEPHQAE
ncbi:SH2 domain containing 3Cb isoform X2 [Clarias gariepinus]|uniref:SH2 domain containing 3Cb isoform X2 n=1 Tax=Clarias gariepinus TaxID=13013 RepID=UPI00234DF3A6|nr:SH2 domain containing 3Cb isoform X2 [Clarias gariepinus]XP_053337427.1 SH2 domain containing 3Cb isoform X2 [Clarias gariepinus]